MAGLGQSWGGLGCTGGDGSIDVERGVSTGVDSVVSDAAGVWDMGGGETVRCWVFRGRAGTTDSGGGMGSERWVVLGIDDGPGARGDVARQGGIGVVGSDVLALLGGRLVTVGPGDGSGVAVGRLGVGRGALGAVEVHPDKGRMEGAVWGVCDVAAAVRAALGEAGVWGLVWGVLGGMGSDVVRRCGRWGWRSRSVEGTMCSDERICE
jgi:hypothetical protein